MRRLRSQHRFALSLMLAWLATGCDSSRPAAGVLPLEPPAQYQLWWQLTEACSGRTGSFNDIHWYYVPGAAQFSFRGTEVEGLWSGGITNRILLAESDVQVGSLVRHEMLHALLGRGDHPPEFYQGKCGGYVDCDSACVGNNRPASVPVDAPTISPYELELDAALTPTTTANSDNGGWIAVTVTARNPFNHPVWVLLQSFNGSADTFAAIFDNRIKARNALLTDRVGFLANEVQRSVLDIQFTSGGTVTPGTYFVRPEFNWDSLPNLTLTVTK